MDGTPGHLSSFLKYKPIYTAVETTITVIIIYVYPSFIVSFIHN